MRVKFEDIREAFDFVNFGPLGDHTAVLDKSTGRIYWNSESGDLDEIPEALFDSEDAIEIPHKSDLGVGSQLVFEFVRMYSPEDYERVRDMFGAPGAYARYKYFLDLKNLLQLWFDFEMEAQDKALREWCKVNGLGLIG